MSVIAPQGRIIARQNEIADVAALVLDGPDRVVTLTGIGGAGKTTIAVHVAGAVEPELADGAWAVDLAARSAESIAHRTALALGLADQSREPVAVLEEFVAPRQALLVLDNCEHVVDEVADLLVALLAAAPDLRVLTTSRVPLRVPGERIYAVPPLAVPAPADASPEDLRGVPSVELFLDRARAGYPGFELTDATAPAVADICRRLEGIPLALEVAAGSLIALSVEDVRARVAAGVDGSGPALRGRPEHQRTVQATLDWSVELLPPAERVLLRRLSVFAGGWTAAAVGPVCSLDGDLADPVGALVTLVEHSLVARVGDGASGRYRLLDPVRQYTAQLLEASGEGDRVAASHARYHAGVATARLSGSLYLSPADIDRIRAEDENCQAALRWAGGSGAADVERALLLGLSEYWRVRGLLRVAVGHYEQVLARDGGDAELRVTSLLGVSNAVKFLGDPARALAVAERARDLAVEEGDLSRTWTALGMVGDARADLGDLDGARAAYEEALSLLPPVGAEAARAFYLANTGDFALRSGDLAEAEDRLERALAVFEAGPRMWFAGRVLVQQGEVARRRGDLARAERLVIDGLRRLAVYGAVVEAVPSLEELGRVEADLGQRELATLVLGAASALRDEVALAATPGAKEELETLLGRLRDELGEARFPAAWAMGRATGLDEAVRAAAERVVPRGEVTAARSTLTPREWQVAELVSQGLTNRAVAERLGMAPGTARIHVERILAKLGLTSRVQVATWVVTAGDERR
ncbi:MAG TPA: LuxR C-terminal-related transcriptional regulator [Phycicoccus sp.]|nr:LuxR C-terminal-related transcriptional regulator [Phycicoccus sp.]